METMNVVERIYDKAQPYKETMIDEQFGEKDERITRAKGYAI